MKKILLAPLALCCSLAYAADDGYLVKNIQFSGLQRVTKGAALLKLPIRIGDKIDKQEISDSIRSLFSSKNFSDIKAVYDNGSLLYVVQERPTIAKISFSGNKSIEDKQLQKSLDSSGMNTGEALDQTRLNEIERSLEDFYYSVGKYSASVKAVVTPLPRNRVDISFIFTEGRSAKIKQINFIGNSVFSDSDLKDRMKLSADSSWFNIFNDDKYKKQVLGGDLERIKSFYLNNGYLKFKIASTNVSLTPDKKGVYLTFNLSEGNAYTVKSIKLNGTLAGHETEFNELVKFDENELYDGSKITLLENKIKEILGNAGYAYPKVKTIPTFNDKNSSVDLVVNVEQGKRFYVRNINFTGNTTTKDEVLRREMRQMESSWLDAGAVDQGKRRLSRLGYFNKVDVATTRVARSNDQIDVTYNVEEGNPGSINFGIGYGTSSGMTYKVGLSQKNFLGTGNKVKISAIKNDYETSANLSYTNPYFTMDGVSLGGTLFYSKFDAAEANISGYTNDSYGISGTLGFPYDENNSFGLTLGYTHNELSNIDTYVQLDKFKDTLKSNLSGTGSKAKLTVQDVYATAGWVRNTLDKGRNPTEGNYQKASLKVAVPGSDVQYYKAQYDIRQYFPLTEKRDFVLLLRGRVGYGNGYGDDAVLPFYDNFYAGGYSTIRGFKSNTAGPKALYHNGANKYKGSTEAIGGNAIALASVELFVPVPFIAPEFKNTLRTSVFMDAGSVWDTEFDYEKYRAGIDTNAQYVYDYSDPTNYRVSYGAALQWVSPIGPLVFSLAKPLKSYDGDDEEFFSFTIGKSF